MDGEAVGWGAMGAGSGAMGAARAGRAEEAGVAGAAGAAPNAPQPPLRPAASPPLQPFFCLLFLAPLRLHGCSAAGEPPLPACGPPRAWPGSQIDPNFSFRC